MLKKVRRFIEENKMLEPNDRVIAAVSGGADSVCLLSALCALAPELLFSLRVVHVNHGLRGAEADRDEQFVRNLCKLQNVPFAAVHRDVEGYAAERGISCEEAGRLVRYEALYQAAEEWGQARIAVAHHAGDSAETILHNLLRGSGLKGLSGIRPVQGAIIRPLLCVTREEILAYLGEQGLSWCEDSTNGECGYTRNRIRNRILPMMREEVNARAQEHILQAGTIIGQADDYLERQALKVWAEAGILCATGQGVSACVRREAFLRQEDIIRAYLIRHMLDLVTPGWRDISALHFLQIAALAEKETGNCLNLPCGMTARREYDELLIERLPAKRREADAGQNNDGKSGVSLRMTTFPRQKNDKIPKNQYTKWFDYDKIKDKLSVRTRREGDYLTLPGGKHKTLRRFMIDEKIPRERRDKICVLAEGSHVLWVVGYRVSEYYKITDDTETILQVSCDGGEDYGR